MAPWRIVGTFFLLASAIFVILAFTGPSPRGIFVFLAIEFIVLGVIFAAVARRMTRSAIHTVQLLRDGLPGDATISSIVDTGVTFNNNPRVKLQLHVVPQNGDPFDISATMLVSRLAVPRVGETYKIMYSATNPQDFAFVDNSITGPVASVTVRANLTNDAASVGGTTVVKGPIASALFKAAGGSKIESDLKTALSDPALRDQLAHVHNAEEAKQVLRSVLGDRVDTANVTFQSKAEVIPSAAVSSSSTAPAASPSIVDQLTKLEQLRDNGTITTEEFEAIKQKLLAGA